MSEPAAIRATFHNFKNIWGRKVLQLHFEVPIEEAGKVYEALGWPDPANPEWVGIALLKKPEGQ